MVVGEPSQELIETYKIHRDIYRATIDNCRPGARASDIYHFANNAFNDAGKEGKVALGGRLVAPVKTIDGPFRQSLPGEGNGGGIGAPHRLLALVGHGLDYGRRAPIAFSSDQYRRDDGCWVSIMAAVPIR